MRIAFSIITCALLACCAIHSPQAGPVGFRLQSSVRDFNPTVVTNMAAWWAARKESAFIHGDSVGTVADQTGNGLSLTQATASKKPLFLTGQKNGLPAFSADGVDDFLSGGDILDIGTGSIHFFLVAKFDSVSAASSVMAKSLYAGSIFRYALYQDTSDWFGFVETSGSVNIEAKGGTPDTSWHLFEFVVDRTGAGTVKVFVDGAEIGSGSLGGDASNYITALRFLLFAYNNATDTGETLFMPGKIAEVWCWQRVLTGDERTTLRNGANSLYSIY